jgi:hypothetical protein
MKTYKPTTIFFETQNFFHHCLRGGVILWNAKSIKACFCRRGEKSFALTMRYVAEQSFRAKKRAFI